MSHNHFDDADAMLNDFFEHVRKTRHTSFLFNDTFSGGWVGLFCGLCSPESYWSAPHPGDLISQSKHPYLVEIHKTPKSRKDYIEEKIKRILEENPPKPPRSIYEWIRAMEGAGW